MKIGENDRYHINFCPKIILAKCKPLNITKDIENPRPAQGDSNDAREGKWDHCASIWTCKQNIVFQLYAHQKFNIAITKDVI